MKGKFMDALNTMKGNDLDGTPVKEGKVKKPARGKKSQDKKGSAPESNEKTRKDVATDDAKFAAYDYAHDKDALSNDVLTALKTGGLSPELEKLLQVLFDKAAVRELVSAQGGVRAPIDPNSFTLEFEFINKTTGENCDDQAESLILGGMDFDQLSSFNIDFKVVRRKADGSEEKATDKEVQQVKDKILAEAKAEAEDDAD